MQWTAPYLETCCRSALHRLVLAGEAGRPGDMKDANCLARLAFMGLALARDDGRFAVSREGQARHAAEILRPPDPLAAAEKA